MHKKLFILSLFRVYIQIYRPFYIAFHSFKNTLLLILTIVSYIAYYLFWHGLRRKKEISITTFVHNNIIYIITVFQFTNHVYIHGTYFHLIMFIIWDRDRIKLIHHFIDDKADDLRVQAILIRLYDGYINPVEWDSRWNEFCVFYDKSSLVLTC